MKGVVRGGGGDRTSFAIGVLVGWGEGGSRCILAVMFLMIFYQMNVFATHASPAEGEQRWWPGWKGI